MGGSAKGEAQALGAVACGHPATAAAAEEILAEGGNAFDAVLAAFCASCVAEPVLCSLGGGGFLLAQAHSQSPVLYDFFVQTPKQRKPERDLDFYPILADFGTATQEFHIGVGAIATPGAVRGLFTIHRELASLPLTRLVEPAIRLARDGVTVRPIDAYLFQVVSPILIAKEESRRLFIRENGALLAAGQHYRQLELADCLEALVSEGEALFYDGELARKLVTLCREEGGLLAEADLSSYQVVKRKPFITGYREAEVITNPPPSCGGILIGFALNLLAEESLGRMDRISEERLLLMTRVMDLTNKARIEARLEEASGEAEEAAAAARLFDPALLERYTAEVAGQGSFTRGTTHISVADAAGNLAAMSLSNGEGCGRHLPGTGIMLNNMLGEEDLNPRGFHAWHADCRLSSMMAPSLAFLQDGSVAALGSGGSNRIRTAILQTLVNLIDFDCGAAEAVEAPRVHFENGLSNLEQDLGKAARDAVGAASERTMEWPRQSFFFGGVHCARRDRKGALEAAGDPRREGVALLA